MVKVNVESILLTEICVNTILRKSDAFSPILFYFLLEQCIRLIDIVQEVRAILEIPSVNLLAIEDDTVLLRQ